MENNLKYCKHCGELIPQDAVICTKCGRQVEDIGGKNPQFIINNSSSSSARSSATATVSAPVGGRYCNKWVSFFLCLFLGYIGGHKFYEGKIGTGLLYIFTFGIFGIGWFIDFFTILCKPNPYLVY